MSEQSEMADAQAAMESVMQATDSARRALDGIEIPPTMDRDFKVAERLLMSVEAALYRTTKGDGSLADTFTSATDGLSGVHI